MDKIELIKHQNKSLLIVEFLSIYTCLEDKIKKIFQNKVDNLETKDVFRLYFLYGAMACKFKFDFKDDKLKADSIKYDEKEKFHQLNMNQIVKIDDANKIISDFNFDIESVQQKLVHYSFHYCCLRFISMRNKLAHELYNVSFGEGKDVVELLSDANIESNNFSTSDGVEKKQLDDNSKAIYSNIIYMLKVIDKLNKIK